MKQVMHGDSSVSYAASRGVYSSHLTRSFDDARRLVTPTVRSWEYACGRWIQWVLRKPYYEPFIDYSVVDNLPVRLL
jgi:hypothetical protein